MLSMRDVELKTSLLAVWNKYLFFIVLSSYFATLPIPGRPWTQAAEFQIHGGGDRREFFIIIATTASGIHFRADPLQDCSLGFNLTNNSKFPKKKRDFQVGW